MLTKIKKRLYKMLKTTYRGDKFLYQRHLNFSYDFSKPLLLIYTMGKVGSTSIYESLKKNASTYTSIHVHRLNTTYLKNREDFIKKEVYKTNLYPKHIHTDLLWKPLWIKKLLSKVKKQLHIITVVREPISRNISLFFQWIDFEEKEDSYTFKSRNNNYPFNINTPKNDLSELYAVFFNRFTMYSHEEWLQNELKDVFQLDIIAKPFNKEKGYSILKRKNIKLLTLKLECLDTVFEEALDSFIDERISLIKANEANTKEIKSIYNRFKRDIQFPEKYIDALYSSDYVKHFYTASEIESFKLKWKFQPHG